MEHYLTLRIVHGATAVLLLLGVIVHLIMLWKAGRGSDEAVLQRKLQRTRRLSLPVTGWWLTHLAGWPLGQFWLLASSVLLLVLIPLVLLLAGRLSAWQAAGSPTAARNAAIYAVLVLVVLIAITALMGAKPV
jgi:uncharacterized membrane protein